MKISTPKAFIIIFILVGGLLVFSVFAFRQFNNIDEPHENTPEEIPNNSSEGILNSPIMKFSIEYPPETVVRIDRCFEDHGPIADLCRSTLLFPYDLFPPSGHGKHLISIESWTKFTIRREGFTNFNSFQEYVGSREEDLKKAPIPGDTSYKLIKEYIILVNEPAIKFTTTGKFPGGYDYKHISIYTQHKGRMYSISTGCNLKNDATYISFFENILSTFKFTE